ncbi:MAG: metallophosphatase family protein [Methanocorpusculum sp.]|nr:metallophosphatase family protein [Methanocorpusculum sp.]
MTGYLPGFLTQEEETRAAYFGNTGFMDAIRPGIAALGEDRETKRAELHQDANLFWKKNGNLWSTLEQNLTKPLLDLRLKTISVPDSVSAIAFFADVHANLPALLAITEDAKIRGCTTFLHAGDVIGFDPFPDENLGPPREINVAEVQGNAEEVVLAVGRTKNCPAEMDKKRYARHRRTWKKPWKNSRMRGTCTPVCHAGRDTVHMGRPENCRHAHPVSSESLCRNTRTGTGTVCADTGTDVIICGHIHCTFARKMHGAWIANTGGAGLYGDGDLQASYQLATRDPFLPPSHPHPLQP